MDGQQPSQSSTVVNVPAAVPMPSADLINFRFDQQAKTLAQLDRKLDKLTNNFLSKEEARMLVDERDAKINALKQEHDAAILELRRHNDTQQWYWRAVVTAVLLALAASLFNFVVKVPKL